MANLAKRIRRLLFPLRFTPLHPQWLVFIGQGLSRRIVSREAQGKVLDIGCGDRWASHAMASDCDYVGLDYPATVIKGYTGRADVFADAGRLPFANASFNSVLLLDVLEHLPDPQTAISECARVLAPEGKLIAHVPFMYPLHDEPYDFQRWTGYGLRSLCERSGFFVYALEPVGHPCAVAAALVALSLAKSWADALSSRHLTSVLLPVVLVAIPIVNLSGWLLSKLFPSSAFMPIGYRMIAIKAT